MSYAQGVDQSVATSEARTSTRVLQHNEPTAPPCKTGGQGFVVIGGCHGLFVLPADELSDFYKGYGCVALAGFAWLGIVALIRLMS